MDRRRGFTLIELLVVIGIIAVLIAILLPAPVKARRQAQGVACMAQIRQMMTATMMYADANKGILPPYYEGVSQAIPGTHFADRLAPFLSKSQGIWIDPERHDYRNVPYDWPGITAFDNIHYNVIGFYFNFVYEQGVRTQPKKFRSTKFARLRPNNKLLLFHCTNRGGLAGPGIWGGYLVAEGTRPTDVSVAFADGHAERAPAKKMIDWTARTGDYVQTYPPGNPPGSADWWTVPWYSRGQYPWRYGQDIPSGW